jgi:hypothetical protein
MGTTMLKQDLVDLIQQKKTIRQIGETLHKSQGSIRYWLKVYGLVSSFSDGKRRWTDEQMKQAIASSETIADVLRKLGLSVRPGNYDTVRAFVKKHGISTVHMIGKRHGTSGKKLSPPLEEVLVEHSTYSRSSLKRRLIKDGLIKEVCDICEMLPKWNGMSLKFVLDHKNGVHDDNRLFNLRLLCPNCNSQQSTFCGKNLRIVNRCADCSTEISRNAIHCCKCMGERYKTTVARKVLNRPSKEELKQLIENNSWVSIGKLFGVSDKAIVKWAKSYGLTIIPRRGSKGFSLEKEKCSRSSTG